MFFFVCYFLGLAYDFHCKKAEKMEESMFVVRVVVPFLIWLYEVEMVKDSE